MAESKTAAEREAERTRQRAQEATEAAEKAEVAAVREVADEAGTKMCPKCKGLLIKHGDENPYKAGAWHCNDCGTCWAPGIKEPRS